MFELHRRTPRQWPPAIALLLLAPAMLLAIRPSAAAPATTRSVAPKPPSLDEVVAKLPRFTVAGQVLDKAGKGVEGADVFLYYARGEAGMRDRLAGQMKSDATGAYRFENAGVWEPQFEHAGQSFTPRYYVIARHPQHGIDFTTIIEGDATDKITVQMSAPKKYKVSVTDSAGKPVAGAKVFLAMASHPDNKTAQSSAERQRLYLQIRRDIGLSSAQTDASGAAELVGTSNESSFWAQKDGYAPGIINDDKIILFPSASISGKVTYDDGTPAAGAAVWYTYRGASLMYDDVAMTDAQGRYALANVPAQGFRYSSQKPEDEPGTGEATLKVDDLRNNSPFVAKAQTFPIKPRAKLTKDLVLQGGCIVAGTITDLTTGKPAANMCFYRFIHSGSGSFTDYAEIKADDQGRFRLVVAPGSIISMQWQRSSAGDYLIDEEWERSDYTHTQPVRARAIAADVTDLALQVKLVRVSKLAGRAIDAAGQGAKSAMVYLRPDLPGVKCDATGAFVLKTAPVDRDFDLCILSADKKLGKIEHLKAGAADAAIKLEPTQSIEGQAADTNGRPSGGLKFSLHPKIGEQTQYNLGEEIKCDARGKFTAANLIAGATYVASWGCDNEDNRDYDTGEATIDLAKLKKGEPVRIEARQYINALLGKALDEKGQPLAGAAISVSPAALLPQNARMNRGGAQITTDKDGEFIIQRLADGDATLRIFAKGYKTARLTTRSDSVDVNVALQPATQPSRCDVTVVDQDGKALADAPVVLWQRTRQDDRWTTTTQPARTDAAGKTTFQLPPADGKSITQSLVISRVRGSAVAVCAVPSNEDLDARLVLKKGERWHGVVLDDKDKPLAGAKVAVSAFMPDPDDYQSQVSLETGPDWTPFALQLDGAPLDLEAVCDAQGRFELAGVDAKDCVTVHISAPAHSVTDEFLNPRQTKEKLTFHLSPAGAIHGQVVLKATGKPPALKGEGYLYVEGERGGSSRLMNPDGTFALEGLAAGSYTVRFVAGDSSMRKYVCPAPPQVEVVVGKTAQATIELEEGILLRGKLVGAKGAKVTGAVMAHRKGDERATLGAGIDKDGSWQFYLPGEGEYQLSYYVQNAGAMVQRQYKTIEVKKDSPMEEIVIEVDAENK